jgi:hypothetical protein
MIRIIQQTFAEQSVITTLGTNFRVMGGKVTDKTTTGDEKQVCIIVGQTGKGIEGETVNGHKDQSREWEHL